MRALSNAAFRAAFNKRASQQLLSFGVYAQRLVKEKLAGGDFAALGIQAFIKGHGTPYLESGQFIRSHRFKYYKEGRSVLGVAVGIFEGTSNRGLPYLRLAEMLQGKPTVRAWAPTESERRAVFAKAGPHPSYPSKPMWSIPARPYLLEAIGTIEVANKFADAMTQAFEIAMTDVGLRPGIG